MADELPRGGTILSRDDRTILAIHWAGDHIESYIAGSNGITKIVAYDENGLHCYLPCLAVFYGDEILARVPAQQVTVVYETTP